jgi:hypothetical protein
MESGQVPNRWMDKENVECVHRVVLFPIKKSESTSFVGKWIGTE